MNKNIAEANKNFIGDLPIDSRGVLMLSASSGTEHSSYSNVPVNCLHHSPDGFAWGYEGSGPADLALNIVDYAVKKLGLATQVPVKCYIGECSGEAWLLHQSFKHDYIARVPDIGGVITWQELSMWVTSSLQPKSDEPFIVFPVLRITIVYPNNLFDTLNYVYGNIDTELSEASFLSMIEDEVLSRDPYYEFEHVAIDISASPANIIVNDSASSLEETDLSIAVQNLIGILFENPGMWAVK